MVTLHDAIKTIQNGVFVLFQKRTKTCFFPKETKNAFKKQVGCFKKKRVFLNPDYLSTFFAIFL